MRQILLIFSLFCASYLTVNAQTNTWTGAGANDNWNTVDNWSLNALPSSNGDVVIPTGFTVNVNVGATTRSIVVEGNSTLNIANSLSFLGASSFAKDVTVNWTSGSLLGGGTLTNNGTINMSTTSTKNINENTVVNNNNAIIIGSNFTLYIYAGTLNNQSSGVIDIQALANLAPYSGADHGIVNAGLIKKTKDSGVANISVALTNTGTIAVEKGSLNLTGEAKTFTGGVYNVTSESTLGLLSTINLSNTMTGRVDGSLNWSEKLLVAEAAAFNFTGAAGINWNKGSLDGGGTLTNRSQLNMTTTSTKSIESNSTLSNTGVINCMSTFTLYIYSGVLNNQSSGIIDIRSLSNLAPYTSGIHSIVNSGTIKKTEDSGTATISVAMTNTGTISVERGVLTLNSEPKTFNDGVYNVSSGALMNLSTKIISSGALSGVLAGPMSWNNELNVAKDITASLSFTGATGLNWASGSLVGGGTLINTSKLNMTTTSNKNITEGSTLNNTGTLNCVDSYTLYIYEGILNNQSSGIINIQALPNFAPYSSNTHRMINSGLIKKVNNTGTAQISVAFTNTGTIAVESGVLNMSGEAKTFTAGIYNVSDGSNLNLTTTVDCSEILEGNLNGPMSWTNDINVVANLPANFNFSGTTGINWTAGSLIGGGTLTNAGKLNMTTTSTKNILGGSTLSNTGDLNILGNFTLYIYDGVLDNQTTGMIDIQSLPNISPYSTGSKSIVNSGLIKKTGNTGVAQLNVPFTNSGTIDSQSGTLKINPSLFTNTIDGIITGTGTIDLPVVANYTNDGTFAPGGSPGILKVVGDYKSSASSVLDVELNGPTQGQEYDLLAITGKNVVFDGRVNVTLDFKPEVNDEFIVATASGTISTCTLATTTATEFDGMLYSFNVSCKNDKEVVLKLQSVVLGIDDYELADSSIKLYPNPVKNLLTIKNTNNLELESGQIIDLTGKVITTYDLKGMGITKEISLENYANGLYFLKIKSTDGAITKRIVKE